MAAEQASRASDRRTLELAPSLTLRTVTRIWEQLQEYREEDVIIDGSRIEDIDSAGISLLDAIRDEFPRATLHRLPEKVRARLERSEPVTLHGEPESFSNPFLTVGDAWHNFLDMGRSSLILTADLLVWSVSSWFVKMRVRRGDFGRQLYEMGVSAVGILSLLSFVIGVIMALQSAAQLTQFGADIFVADLVAVAMIREMGPMMTAIIVAGRTGSAIASEVATMRVTEELDALQVMGVDQVRYVLMPKFNAMTISMPLLVGLSVFLGILGGMVLAFFYLNINPLTYLGQSLDRLALPGVFLALMKSIAFGWEIVIIGAISGMRAERNAESVGRAATNAVVSSIFAVIVTDVIFSLMYLG